MTETTEPTLKRRVSDLLALGRKLYRARPDLQAAFADPEGSEFWAWLQTHGCMEHREVLDLSVPLPPLTVQQFVNPDSWGYLLCGASIYRMLVRVAAEAGKKLEDVAPILDFGCGPGRAMRFLFRHAREVRCVGIDVDAAAIEWCKANFPYGEFHLNQERPPTALAPASFGLAYGISVFSHLSEENHFAWLGELARLLRPGGLAVLTVHGRHSLERAKQEDAMLKLLSLPREDLDRARSVLDAKGFAFVRQPGGHLNRDLYGITFVTDDFVRKRWSKDFEVKSYRQAGLDDWQDVVVLQCKS